MTTFKRQEVPREKTPSAAIAKWGYPVLAEGFVPFPKKLLRRLPAVLGENALEKLQVILAIVDYLREDLKSPPSAEFLAFIAGLQIERFKTVLGELQEAELIEVAGSDECLMISLKGLKDLIISEAEAMP